MISKLNNAQLASLLAKTYSLVADLFIDKNDKGGQPYFKHCYTVAKGVAHLGFVAEIAAMLHDVVEDTHITLQDLRDKGYPEEIITVVDLLTHPEGMPYMDQIERLSINKLAVEIKKKDLRHNSDILRLKNLTKSNFKKIQTYFTAHEYLKKI